MATRRELEQTSFLYGGNGAFLEELYARYIADPQQVDPSWRAYFDELGPDNRQLFERARAALEPRPRELRVVAERVGAPVAVIAPSLDSPAIKALVRDHLRVIMLIRAYRVRGHLIAKLDPLGLTGNDYHPELDWRTYGFTEADLDREFYLDYVLGLEKATLRKIVEVLQRTYSGTIGIEFLHIQDPEQKAWIQARVENPASFTDVTAEEKREILEQLTVTEGFEQFLHVKFPGTKRFGLDGGESAIPALETIIRTAAGLGVEEIVLGMAHRGRLNVLANVMGKPYAAILSEFQGAAVYDRFLGSGDVKYHLGTSTDRTLPDGRTIHLSLTANPSHLEAVNPVVMGKVRAKQRQRGDTAERSRVMGLLIHGDAAFIGQGVVHECLEMCELKGYRIGGVVHLIVNNQIGFTTSPHASRSSPYPSDVARGVQCPIFHVNGDDPVAVTRVARLATEFRQKFKKDVVIDLWCYRRHGHNEGDEPSFTQPIMYRKIARHPTVRQVYAQALEREGVVKPGEAGELLAAVNRQLEAAHEASRTYKSNQADWLEGAWKGLKRAPEAYERGSTAVPIERLRELGERITELPESLKVHPRLKRIIAQRREAIRSGEGIDWATAEHLAFATLLAEGFAVRLSGQDVGRGTFSQRHAIIYDQETEERYVPLQTIPADPHDFECFDSHLSEEAVLGYEYGHSLADPNCLTIWEAQFGDFANGAQSIVDEFVSSGEVKWGQPSSLTLLLPHSHEGQGPDHTSGRLERYLQLCAEDNMRVAVPTTPANYFHLLRRQALSPKKKPLVVFTPKSLLRHRLVVSAVSEFTSGTFRPVIGEATVDPSAATRVILCSGKVYYDLLAGREERKIIDIALVRLEQLYPLPVAPIKAELARYPNVKDIVWVQEEPANQGAWTYIAMNLVEEIPGLRLR
ncbi:MAG: 2-oxoglutarate dehydrogenase E1 component, partial [Geminicoccaceae bacterium]|nr:2-oxoglutarate dehydrogenase E1 component [Geminicoccaceae bacterium]